ncbi:hypothetical protein AB0876_03860 [Mycobacterium sp. NPDC049093]
MSLPKRIYDKIEFRHSTDPNRTACWMWTGYAQNGYPSVSHKGQNTPTKVAVYELLRRPIPDGHRLRHTCPHKACVNPNHLELKPTNGSGDQQ